jgi:hypothetical protein
MNAFNLFFYRISIAGICIHHLVGCTTTTAPSKVQALPFKSSVQSIPQRVLIQMQRFTWHKGCPVPLHQLAYVKLRYWGFDQQPHTGVLIVNQALVPDVIHIFKALYQQNFPIQRMQLMDDFKGDDDKATQANNTSAFNCRAVTGHPGIYSQHSYGRAIDINPLINPFVKGRSVSPIQGLPHVDRALEEPGKITQQSLIYRLFSQHGWDWGGHWVDVQDYQHVEKRAHGERRNPYGY